MSNADKLFNQSKCEEALQLYIQLAFDEKDKYYNQTMISYMYVTGIGTCINLKKSKEWAELACKGSTPENNINHYELYNILGVLESNIDRKKSLFNEALKTDNLVLKESIYFNFYKLYRSEQNYSKALEYILQAIALDNKRIHELTALKKDIHRVTIDSLSFKINKCFRYNLLPICRIISNYVVNID